MHRHLIFGSVLALGCGVAACGDDKEATTTDSTTLPDGLAPDGTIAPETDSGGGGGSLTGCELSFAESNPAGKAFGQSCASNAECRFGACILPGSTGNVTNAKFGFCTRGCDCENAVDSQIIPAEKETYECLYPSGAKDFHHVVVECSNVSTCQAIDPQWTSCELPSSGGARKVCHAL